MENAPLMGDQSAAYQQSEGGDPSGMPESAPPGSNTSAFAEALKKAQELAAGIRQQQAEGTDGLGVEQGYKRPNEDSNALDNPAKRPMPAMSADAANFDFAAAQAQAQARAAKIMQGMMPNAEEVKVPNRMVGIIIGKSGETINRLQADSNARIQCAPAQPGNPQDGERVISVTGTPEAIAAAKMMIQALVDQGPDNPAPQQPPMPGMPESEATEIMIPQAKVGLIIGKGGETIKRLQQQANCHMQMVQDGPYASAPMKPLRIQGNQQAMDHAKQLVEELMAERDAMGGGGGGGQGGGQGGGHMEIPVPREMVGMVIGRGGETIKKIQHETGVRIQFSQEQMGGAVRQAILTGPPDGLPLARQLVTEILERAESSGRGGGGGGGGDRRDRDRDRDRDGPMNNSGGGPMEVFELPVPGAKCGLVIGRGGETIRALQAETGCHIQLNRNAPCGPEEKVFTLRGDPSQIAHAQDMIRQKCDMPPSNNFGGNQQQQQQQQQQQPFGQQNMMGGSAGGAPLMGGQMQPMGQQHMQGQQMQMHGQMPMQQGMYGQQQQQWGQQYQVAGQQAYPQQGQQQGQDVQAQQQAWAQYYQQYYQQQQQQQQQQPQAAPGTTPAATQQPATSTAQSASQSQPATSQAQASTADIQAQWQEYYRQMGYTYPAQQPAQ